MASNTHVDSRVQERRIRIIYDWLDSGNNKKALQEAEKVLKKQPNFLCAKVLKALILQRLGREAECEELLEEACSYAPTDEATLQAITICYRAIHKPEKICDVYTAASKKDPTNEELLTHLFMSYVRVGNYRKQHQHAMSLYKLRPKNPYYFWAVMSVVMQAKTDENIGKTVALKLAEKMVSKFVTEGKIEAEQEVQLYLMILEMQGKYEEALDVIEGELGEKLKSLVTTATKRIELLIKLERWKEANVLLKCQIEKNPDSWSDYKNYLKTMVKLYNEYQKTKNEIIESNNVFDNRVPIRVPFPNNGEDCIMWYDADYTPEMAKTFFRQLIKNADENKKLIRGPHLAQLELYKVLEIESLEPESVMGDVVDLLVDYFNRFVRKPICVLDLKPYISLLSTEAKSIFRKRISEAAEIKDEESPSSESALQKHILMHQLNRLLGFHNQLSTEEKLKLCKVFIDCYNSTSKFVPPDKLLTEFSCNDPYIILLSHMLFSLYQDSNSRIHIVRAIHHLEKALVASPSNFHFKLLLLRFYLLLGAGQQAYFYFEQLEVKNIQLDSLAYLFTTSGYGLGCCSVTTAVYDATLKFFLNNTNDSADHLTHAYKFGSFMKIQEFIEFRDRLNDAVHNVFCTVEKMLHDLLWTASYSQSEVVVKSLEIKSRRKNICWTKLQDNRNLSVVISYEPSGQQLNDRTKEKTFNQLKNYVRLRDGILKCMCAVFDYVSDESEQINSKSLENGDSECLKSVLIRVISELKEYSKELMSQDLESGIQDVINAPPPCRLKQFLKLPVCQVMSDLIEVILLSDSSKENEANICAHSESASKSIESTTQSCIDQLSLDSVQNREVLENLVGVAEMLAIATILCGNLKCHSKRLKKNLKKGRRKKEEEGSLDLLPFKNFLNDLSECVNKLGKALTKINEEISEKVASVEGEISNGNDSKDEFSDVEKKLYRSYGSSLQEIREFLQERLTYLNDLKT